MLECVKKLKKKQAPEFSKEAEEVLARWKSLFNLVNNNVEISSNKIDKNRSSGLSSSKLADSSSVKSSSTAAAVGNKNNHQQQQLQKNNRVSPSSSSLSSSPTDTMYQESKKPKLSLADYKGLKKENVYENEQHQRPSTTIKNMPTQPVTKTIIKNEKSMSLVGLASVPLPTMPLPDILSSLMPTGSASSTSSSSSSSSSYGGGHTSSMRYLDGGGLGSLGASRRDGGGGGDDDATLASIFQSKKNSKMVLYSGRRNQDGVVLQPSKLFDMATRVLIDNLDDLPARIAIYSKIIII